jgi:hypothetical protein
MGLQREVRQVQQGQQEPMQGRREERRLISLHRLSLNAKKNTTPTDCDPWASLFVRLSAVGIQYSVLTYCKFTGMMT